MFNKGNLLSRINLYRYLIKNRGEKIKNDRKNKKLFKDKYNMDLNDEELADYLKSSKKVAPLVIVMFIPIAILLYYVFGLILEWVPFDMTTYLPLGIALISIIVLANILTKLTQKIELSFVENINYRRRQESERNYPLEPQRTANLSQQTAATPYPPINAEKTEGVSRQIKKTRAPQKKGVIIIAIIIVATVGGILIPMMLSPSFSLLGTWKTTEPTTFYIKTDFINGYLEDVGSEKREVTWTISSGDQVQVEVRFTYSDRSLAPGSGYTPDVSPMTYRGEIDGNTLIIIDNSWQPGVGNQDRVIGTFKFTSDTIIGTWSDSWEMIYAQQVYTAENGLVLTKS